MNFRWILRELRSSPKFTIFFILNLSLGFLGFLTLDSFKNSLNEEMQKNSKNFLSADISISSRQLIPETILQTVRSEMSAGYQEGRLWEFFSMVTVGSQSRLVQIKAIDESYPLYGDLAMRSQQTVISGEKKEIHTQPKIWVYPELLSQLGVSVGDKLTVGNQEFEISDVVEKDSTQTFRLSSLAPKVYVGLNWMKQSSLVQFGTTLSDVYLYKLQNDQAVEKIKNTLIEKIPDTGIRVSVFADSEENSTGALKYLMDYLGLVSLVAMFLAILGSTYLFRNFIFLRLRSIAVVRALGFTTTQVQTLYLIQLTVLGLISAALSFSATYLLFPVLQSLLKEWSPIDVSVVLSGKSLLLALILGPVGTVFIGLPFLSSVSKLNIQELFQEATGLVLKIKWKNWIWLLPAAICYWGLAVWQANSFKLGSLFVASVVGSVLLLTLFAYLFLLCFANPLFDKIKSSWTYVHARRLITRNKASSMAIIISLGLGSLLINLIPQLRVSIKSELEAPDRLSLPSLFLFDIQDEQLSPLQVMLEKENIHLKNISPLVRARILTVNDQAFEKKVNSSQAFKTREEENEARFRNRGFNLSYRLKLTDSEEITRGEPIENSFNPNTQKIPSISVEERFAERLKFHIGDKLKFDIQGIEIEGEIKNFRKVRWNSFQPNFFVSFQPGVLEDAPKTFLASIGKNPSLNIDDLQNKIVRSFPNVSIIDVSRTVNSVIETSEKMSWSLLLMAVLSIFAGLVVTYSISRQQVEMRKWEINTMKILGAQTNDLMKLSFYEFGTLAFISSLIGVLLSFLVSYAISVSFFAGQMSFTWLEPIFTVFAVVLLTVIVALTASYRIFKEKPLDVIQSLR